MTKVAVSAAKKKTRAPESQTKLRASAEASVPVQHVLGCEWDLRDEIAEIDAASKSIEGVIAGDAFIKKQLERLNEATKSATEILGWMRAAGNESADRAEGGAS